MPDYEIELTDGRKFRVTADSPPSEADVLAAIGGQSQPPATQAQAAPRAPMGGLLPSAGGLVGSLVGGVGGALLTPFIGPAGVVAGKTLGAGLGGALGKGAELFFDDKDDTASEALSQMGMAGAGEAGADLAFGAAGKVVKGFAPRLMQSVLKPGKAVAENYGDVAGAAVRGGVPVSQGGTKKVGKLIEASSKRVNDKLAMSQRMGVPDVNMQDVLPDVQRVAQKYAWSPLGSGERIREVSDIGERLIQENPNPIKLLDAQKMKQAAQRDAAEGFKKINAGADISSVPTDANVAIARGLRREIEKRADVGALNQNTQELMGLDVALENALRRIQNNQPIGMNALIASGAGLGAGAGTGDPGIGGGVGLGILALTNPYLASRVAIGADRLSPVIGEGANLYRAALLSQLGEEQ